MNKEKRKQRSKRPRKRKTAQLPMLLTAWNYKWMVAGIGSVLAGFAGMYLENQQFGFISLYLAPILVLGGFGLVAFSVFRTDPSLLSENDENPPQP